MSGRRLSRFGVLVDRQPVVVVYVLKVEQPDLSSGDGAVGPRILDRQAVNEDAVGVSVGKDQRAFGQPKDLPVGFFECISRQILVELGECHL